MSRRIPLVAAMLACCAVALTPSAASALLAPPSTISVRAGETAYMTIVLAVPVSECQLVAGAPGQTPVMLSQVRPTGMKVTWIWQVPGRARSATWRLSATCGPAEIGAVLTVHESRHEAALSLARGVRVLQYNGASSRPTPHQLSRTAQAWWANNSSSILSSFQRGPAAGECTAYVAARRPDIIERVDIWAYSRYLLAPGGGLNVDWAAENWATSAQNAGLAIGKIPRPGAVIVFQPGAYGAYSDGHVAYVDAVGKRGSFTIREMHAPLRGQVTSRHFNAGTARAMLTDPGVTFIYK